MAQNYERHNACQTFPFIGIKLTSLSPETDGLNSPRCVSSYRVTRWIRRNTLFNAKCNIIFIFISLSSSTRFEVRADWFPSLSIFFFFLYSREFRERFKILHPFFLFTRKLEEGGGCQSRTWRIILKAVQTVDIPKQHFADRLRHLIAYRCSSTATAAGHTGRSDPGSPDIQAMSTFPADRPLTDDSSRGSLDGIRQP